MQFVKMYGAAKMPRSLDLVKKCEALKVMEQMELLEMCKAVGRC